MVSSNTVHMKSEWQGGFIHFFRQKVWGLFKDFPGPYFDLYEFTFNQANCLRWKLCFGYKHVHMQKCQTRRAWKHVQTRHSLCISGSMDMHESNERAQGKKTSVFTHFVRISRILCIPEHLFSFTLKLLSVDVFRFCSIKKSRTYKNQNQFQTLSRPFNRTPEIQRLSRCILTLKWTY